VDQLQAYLGLAWVAGCCIFGCLVVQKSTECRIGRQYLCQAIINIHIYDGIEVNPLITILICKKWPYRFPSMWLANKCNSGQVLF
jgi:hypothetical protein